jgi:hypothetical protein
MSEPTGTAPAQVNGYVAPELTMHGSVADITGAFLVGLFVDSNFSQGNLIIGSTSL